MVRQAVQPGVCVYCSGRAVWVSGGRAFACEEKSACGPDIGSSVLDSRLWRVPGRRLVSCALPFSSCLGFSCSAVLVSCARELVLCCFEALFISRRLITEPVLEDRKSPIMSN